MVYKIEDPTKEEIKRPYLFYVRLLIFPATVIIPLLSFDLSTGTVMIVTIIFITLFNMWQTKLYKEEKYALSLNIDERTIDYALGDKNIITLDLDKVCIVSGQNGLRILHKKTNIHLQQAHFPEIHLSKFADMLIKIQRREPYKFNNYVQVWHGRRILTEIIFYFIFYGLLLNLL